jgi:hypothetical protein
MWNNISNQSLTNSELQQDPNIVWNPISVVNALTPEEEGTETSKSYSWIIDYIWENHSNFYSLLRRFDSLRNYENHLNMSSEELLTKWKSNTLVDKGNYINDWLTLYLQTKDFIK